MNENLNENSFVELDDAELELSVEQGRHLTCDNPYRLKITIKNAQYGERYFTPFWMFTEVRLVQSAKA